MRINVAGSAFNIMVAYIKFVRDVDGQPGFAITWHTGATGTHSSDANFIVSGLSQQLDEFLVQYLRVNEGACRLSETE